MVMYFNAYTLKRKLKRIKQQKKNRHHQLLFQLMRMRQAEARRLRDNAKRTQPGRSSPGKNTKHSDKVSRVRNRLTGKKRVAKERWNRFSGTSDAGGRGL